MSAPFERENRPRLRIGELSRRSGVRTDTLRAWERRYGLLRPERTEGGFRLYGAEDERRVRTMKSLIDSGVSAAEAARLASATSAADPPRERSAAPLSGETLEGQTRRLRDALEDFDDVAANEVLDEVLAAFTIDALAERVVLPVLREIGNRWESGEASVAQEHFATGVLRARMLSAARNWGAGVGPLALLACPPGELHDLGLVVFGLVLSARGWRIAYLGPDTPIDSVADAARELRPQAIVLAALGEERFEAVRDDLRALAAESRLLLGGAGATDELVRQLGAERLDADPVGAGHKLLEYH